MNRKALTGEGSPYAAHGSIPARAGSGCLDPLIDAAFDAVIVTDQDGVVLEAGGAAARLFGVQPHACAGRPIDELLQVPAAHPHPGAGRGGLSAVDTFPYEARHLECAARHASGRAFPVAVNVARIGGDGPARFVSFVRDLGDLRDAEQRCSRAERELAERNAELRHLALALPLDVESERKRIARGLHDQVGNALAMARIRLADLRHGAAGESLAALEDVERLTATAMQEIRSLTFELSSPVLYELGLEAALKSLGKRLCERHELGFHFVSDDRPKPLPEDHQVILYRIIEELLVNVVKHAWADNARIAVERLDDRIRIAVEDDGVGVEPGGRAAPGPEGGFGLFGVRQRLAHIGGRLEIEAAFPSGTRAVVSAPLDTGAD